MYFIENVYLHSEISNIYKRVFQDKLKFKANRDEQNFAVLCLSFLLSLAAWYVSTNSSNSFCVSS